MTGTFNITSSKQNKVKSLAWKDSVRTVKGNDVTEQVFNWHKFTKDLTQMTINYIIRTITTKSNPFSLISAFIHVYLFMFVSIYSTRCTRINNTKRKVTLSSIGINTYTDHLIAIYIRFVYFVLYDKESWYWIKYFPVLKENLTFNANQSWYKLTGHDVVSTVWYHEDCLLAGLAGQLLPFCPRHHTLYSFIMSPSQNTVEGLSTRRDKRLNKTRLVLPTPYRHTRRWTLPRCQFTANVGALISRRSEIAPSVGKKEK